MIETDTEKAGRAARMSLLARASLAELRHHLEPLGPAAEATAIRGPETGLVMLRGRIGGGGNAFNIGEATVSRASIRLAGGEIGHGQRLGTDLEAARLSAIADALALTTDHAPRIDALMTDIRNRVAAEERQQAAEAAATRVDFFTLVRGED